MKTKSNYQLEILQCEFSLRKKLWEECGSLPRDAEEMGSYSTVPVALRRSSSPKGSREKSRL